VPENVYMLVLEIVLLKIEFCLHTDSNDKEYWAFLSPIFNNYVHGYVHHNYREMLEWEQDLTENHSLCSHIKRIKPFLTRMSKWT